MGMGKYWCLWLTFQVKTLLSNLQERLGTRCLLAQPQTLFFIVPSFHGAVKTKSEKKARPESVLPAVGLEGNTEREGSVHCSIYGCGNRRAQGLQQQPGFFLEFVSARSLHPFWGVPGTEGSGSSVVCVCARVSEQLDNSQTSQSKHSQPQQSWNHFNWLQLFAVVVPAV